MTEKPKQTTKENEKNKIVVANNFKRNDNKVDRSQNQL